MKNFFKSIPGIILIVFLSIIALFCAYQFGYKIGEDSKQEEAHDEDGYSEEEALVWRADEADENEDSEMGSDDEMDLVQKAMVRKHQRTGLRIVAQYDALDAAEGRRSRRNK